MTHARITAEQNEALLQSKRQPVYLIHVGISVCWSQDAAVAIVRVELL